MNAFLHRYVNSLNSEFGEKPADCVGDSLLIHYRCYACWFLFLLETLFWGKNKHDLIVAISFMSKGFLQAVHFHIQAILISNGFGPVNECWYTDGTVWILCHMRP